MFYNVDCKTITSIINYLPSPRAQMTLSRPRLDGHFQHITLVPVGEYDVDYIPRSFLPDLSLPSFNLFSCMPFVVVKHIALLNRW